MGTISAHTFTLLALAAVALTPLASHAQRAKENAVNEATDAFGTTVGRDEIGLYSATSARGFSPTDAGNLRVNGVYFDQIPQARLTSRVIRGSTVHVGISAQGFPFVAPTGVVDFHLRAPGDDTVGGGLLGFASYDQAYAELDVELPMSDVLGFGAGVGYSRNSSYNIAELTHEWTAGATARWRPLEELAVTGFWSMTEHLEHGERAHVFIGQSGWPKYRGVNLTAQPWADYGVMSRNFGALAHWSIAENWWLDAGIFRSRHATPTNIDPFFSEADGAGNGIYTITAAPPRRNASTSGEVSLARRFETERVRNTLVAMVRGRDRDGESGGSSTVMFGPASLDAIPLVAEPQFTLGPKTAIATRQRTLGIGYDGVWRGVGQLSAGVQKTDYERTVTAPNALPVAGEETPWLYNLAAAAHLSERLVAYASGTRGLEEIGLAPLNAANRDEAVPAQLTEQLDAGVQFKLTPELRLVAGVFEITKPYFALDAARIFRRVGETTNRGVEVSLAGALTSHWTVVAGMTLIDPEVEYETAGAGSRTEEAIGPVPRLIRAYFQYRVPKVPGLTLDAKIENTSERYARYDYIRLPAVTVIGAGFRYGTRILGRDATLRLQTNNLTNEYGVTPSTSGRLQPFDSRRFDLSIAFDLHSPPPPAQPLEAAP